MEGSSGAASDAAIETLRTRGWCFGDFEQVEEKILIHPALSYDTRTVVNSVEAELTNMNLKSISAHARPAYAPKVLSPPRPQSPPAVEYSHTPAIPDHVVPETKVCLEGKVTVRNGIVCLSPKVVTVLGGVVQSLYEEWQMNTKYSEFSRSSLRISQESDGNGPSPFEKLQVGAAKSRFPEQDKFSHYSDVSSKSSEPIARITEGRPVGRQWNLQLKANDEDKFYKKSETGNTRKADSFDERTQDKRRWIFIRVQIVACY
ncbi:hypothetical protein ACFX2I_026170 [Malus domestica]